MELFEDVAAETFEPYYSNTFILLDLQALRVLALELPKWSKQPF